jgi:hypothetical protein
MLFISFNAFSYDFLYLESKIPPDSFEMHIYEEIKDVIANSTPERYYNMITFLWNEAEVIIIKDGPTKTRGYDNPDTLIMFTSQTLKMLGIEEVMIIFNQRADFYKFIVKDTRTDNTVRNNIPQILEMIQ